MLRINDNSNPNYLATICKIENVEPMPNASRLVKTIINGYSMIISKDMQVGDLVVYFPCESAICERFLGANNLYDQANYLDNDNAIEVMPLMDALHNEMVGTDRHTNLLTEIKSKCGFFKANGRVRILKLRGEYSQGFISPVSSLEKAWPELVGIDWESLVGTQFNEVNGTTLVEKYIPDNLGIIKTKGGEHQSLWRRAMKKLNNFDRIIPGQFEFHYDTTMLAEHIRELHPDQVISVTTKIHGTSAIFANVLCNKKLSIWKQFVKWLGLDIKSKEYGNVYSSRRIIKNRDIHPTAKDFYEVDVWGEANKILKPYIENGYTIYGEIVGYQPGTKQYIQKNHDYGCAPGEWKFMPYRITHALENGQKIEYNVEDVIGWTRNLVQNHPEISKYIMEMDLLYTGPMRNMYPDISVDENWHKNVLEAIKNDKERLLMEMDEPLCKNKVPREGVVIRVVDDIFPRAWKIKSARHYAKEAEEADTGNANIEDVN